MEIPHSPVEIPHTLRAGLAPRGEAAKLLGLPDRPTIGTMSVVDKLLEANSMRIAARRVIADARPSQRLAVVTCMDARVDVAAALGLRPGAAHVIRNAGGRVTDDVLRSLALSSHALGVDTVVLMQHSDCGVAGVTDEELRSRTGADLDFFSIDDHGAALRDDVDRLTAIPYLEPVKVIAGFLYDVDTGLVDEVLRWERPDPR